MTHNFYMDGILNNVKAFKFQVKSPEEQIYLRLGQNCNGF